MTAIPTLVEEGKVHDLPVEAYVKEPLFHQVGAAGSADGECFGDEASMPQPLCRVGFVRV